MNAADLRNATWADIQPMLSGMRLVVLLAWRMHGPGTTENVAQTAGINLLTFRPRSTELLQLGLIALVDRDSNDGIYEAVPEDQARASFEAARSPQQMPLKLTN
jgi:hypothetical protein